MDQPKGLFFVGNAVKTVCKGKHYLVDCTSCSGLHPFEFAGDCRDDQNSYGNEADYAKRNNVNVDLVVVMPDEVVAA